MTATELTVVPAQSTETQGFFDRIKNAVGDDNFDRIFGLIVTDANRHTRADFVTGDARRGDHWWEPPVKPGPPRPSELLHLLNRSNSKRGVLIVEEIDKEWFELLDTAFGLDPAFVSAYANDHERDLQHRLGNDPAFPRGLKGNWCVFRGYSGCQPEDYQGMEEKDQSSYWWRRTMQEPRGHLKSVVACCSLSPSMRLVIVERSPIGHLPRSSNLLRSNALEFNNFGIPWSFDDAVEGVWYGSWYDMRLNLLNVLSNISDETSSSSLEFNMLFGRGNATELPDDVDSLRLEICGRFDMLLHLTVPPLLQQTVSLVSSQLDAARYEAQTFPSSDTYLPLLAFRRSLADLRVNTTKAKIQSASADREFQKMQQRPKRSATAVYQQFDSTLDQMTKDLNEEVQLIIGAVTVMDADLARQQTDRSTLLTLLAAVYLPLSLVTGIFGMNIRELDVKPKFWWCIVLLVIIVALTLVAYVSFRWWQRGQRSSYEQRRKDSMENGLWSSSGDGKKRN